MGNQKAGIIILSVMACLWCVATALTLPSPWRISAIVVALLVSGLLILSAMKRTFRPGKFDRKIFRLSVAFEAVAILAAVWLLTAAHAAGFILTAIAIIVGLHFIGMWRATDSRTYLVIAAVQCAFGVASTWLPVPPRIWVAGLGSAITLWSGAFGQLAKRR